jgi:Fe-S-cluster containining protein
MLIFLLIMGVEEIAETAKNEISEFCMNKCKVPCCRDTILYLESEEELELLTKGRRKMFEERGYVIEITSGGYALDVRDFGCQQLESTGHADAVCAIHDHEGRPKTCKEYPIILDHKGKIVGFLDTCLAVKKGMLDHFIENFEAEGYTVETF